MDKTMVEIGYRVMRGPDWKWGDQDGGDGHVGTVVEVGHIGNRLSPDKTVIVQWDNGRRTNYRVGYRGAYDLLVFDGAPAGVKHFNKRCDGCGRRGIKGIRWQCTQCSDYDLCTRCYMDNVHNLQHKFRRFLTSKSTGVLIPKRAKSRRGQASGIFPGAKVVRGCDWIWGNQDGGPSGVGNVTETRGWQNESEGSVASVTWTGSGSNVYRVGHRGKIDLKYVTPGKGPMVYKDHLPVLGKDELDPALATPLKRGPFSVGDRVSVHLSVDVLKQMQKGHGGWNPKMADLISIVGTVHRITQAGDVRVQYHLPVTSAEATGSTSSASPADNNRWTFNPAALRRIDERRFAVNESVRVIEDCARVKALQSSEHGNWNEKMKECLGQKGDIVEVYPDGDVRVKFSSPQREWTFNPACLFHDPSRLRNGSASGEIAINAPTAMNGPGILEIVAEKRGAPLPNELIGKVARGDLQGVKQMLQFHPNLVNAKACRQMQGRTALQVAAYKGRTEIVRFLLSVGADISTTDDEGDGALHFAMVSKSSENFRNDCVALLLDKATSTDVNLLNSTKRQSALHVAVIHDNIEWTRRILALGCDVNIQDHEGDTAAHCCVTNHDNGDMMRLLLSQPNFDPKLTNNAPMGFNILHKAALRGQYSATEAILEKFPELALTAKSDGLTALHLSVLNVHQRVTQLLTSKCPTLINRPDNQGRTPLYLAASEGCPFIVDMLVQTCATVNIPASDGTTCIHAALEKYSTQENEQGSNSLSTETETLLSRVSSGQYSALESFPATSDWKEIKDAILRGGLTSENAVYLGIACYLVRVTLDQNPDDDDFLSGAFKIVRDERARGILREFRKTRSMVILASDFSNVVDLSEDAASRKLLSPSPVSRRPLPQSSIHYVPNNFVKSLDHDVMSNVAERQECMSCAEEPASVTFQPCGHKIVCTECCVRMKKCIQCHAVISEKIDEEGRDISLFSTPSIPRSAPSFEQQETVMQLERKVRELQESNQCIICMEHQRDVALKCGHRFCHKCAGTLRKHCPICRKPITGTIRLY